MRLYHGSNVVIDSPQVALNDGFADLGRGFYLTDEPGLARRRAHARARRDGGTPVVSAFELEEGCLPWACWGASDPTLPPDAASGPFALRFDESRAGVAAWANYVKACRSGRTEVGVLGSPSIIRAWLATEEVEMVCAGFLAAEDVADLMSPAELVVQYCITDQGIVDRFLTFVGTSPRRARPPVADAIRAGGR